VIAHIMGIPVEENVLPVVAGISGALVVARAWVAARVRGAREHDEETAQKRFRPREVRRASRAAN
jgi:hypothetical protein